MLSPLADTRDALQVAAERTLGSFARAKVIPVHYSVDGFNYPTFLVQIENGRRDKNAIEHAFIADTLADVEKDAAKWLAKHGTLKMRKAS